MRKNALLTVCVVAGVLAVLALRPAAHAGEKNALGCIFVADGGSENNATTGYNVVNQDIRAFDVPTSALITLQCMTGPCSVAVGATSTTSSRGLYLAALEKITSSTSVGVPTTKADGGSYNKGIVSLAAGTGATSARLCVFERQGNE